MPQPPDLTIEKTLQGVLTDQGGTYLIQVTNVGNGPTIGPVTVMDPMPAGLTLISASGSGWDCSASTSQNMECVYGAVLAPNESAPPITLHVDVQPGLQGVVINMASVSTAMDEEGGNDSGSAAAPITHPAPVPALSAQGLVGSIVVLLLVAALGVRQLRPDRPRIGRSRRRK